MVTPGAPFFTPFHLHLIMTGAAVRHIAIPATPPRVLRSLEVSDRHPVEHKLKSLCIHKRKPPNARPHPPARKIEDESRADAGRVHAVVGGLQLFTPAVAPPEAEAARFLTPVP